MGLLGLLISVLMAADESAAQRTPSSLRPEETQMAELHLQGMKDARDRLVSGIFRARGRKRHKRAGRGLPEIDGEVEFYCAFDYGADLFRFDRKEPQAVGVEGEEQSGEKAPDASASRSSAEAHEHVPAGVVFTVQTWEGKFVRTPERTFHWTNGNPRGLLTEGPEATPKAPATPVDVRTVGLIVVQNLQSYKTFAQIWQFLGEHELIEVAEEREGVCRLVWAIYRPYFLSVWLDRSCGYSPVRLELRRGSLESEPVESGEATWRQISGVWVPDTFFVERRTAHEHAKYELAFEWESVNEPVPAELFTARGLELMDQTTVYSVELGKPVVVERLGADALEPLPEEDRGWARSVVVVASILLILGFLVTVLLLRRRRRPQLG